MSSAYLFDIHTLSGHDGPGMRTVFFFKGCPLRCRWCHNPESFKAGPEIWQYSSSCIGCGRCLEVCKQPGALNRNNSGKVLLDRSSCTNCGNCVSACPTKSLRLVENEYSLEQLLEIVDRERPYMERSGGGVTLSGGEPLLQADFIGDFLKICHDSGLHTALDTSGYASHSVLTGVLPHVDLLLYDIKLMDTEQHKKFTGVSNEPILENIRKIADYIAEGWLKTRLWIRTPLIPGSTDTEENIRSIAVFLREEIGDVLERWELCAFNPLAQEKYDRLGLEWPYKDEPLMSDESVDRIRKMAAAYLADSKRVRVTGLTAGPTEK